MNRFVLLAVGFVAAFVGAGFVAQQTVGYDSATGSICVYDKASPPQCVPIGQLNSTTHAWSPTIGGAAVTGTTGTGATAVLSASPTLSGTVAISSGGKLTIGGTDALSMTSVLPGGTSAYTPRLLVGAVADYMGVYDYGSNRTPLVALNVDSGAGLAAAARTSTNLAAGDIAIGSISWGYCDATGAKASNACWGAYAEARAYPGSSGFVAGGEINVANLRGGAAVPIQPYNQFAAGNTLGLHIASGGECHAGRLCYDPAAGASSPEAGYSLLAAGPSSAGLLIGPNTTTFDDGIVFGCGALTGTDCAGNGAANAITSYVGANVAWKNPAGSQVFTFGSANTTLVGQLGWSNSGLTIGNGSSTLFQFYPGSGAVNGISAVAATTGNAPTWSAFGGDTDIELKIHGKGTKGVTVDRLAVDGSAPTISACGTSPSVWGNASSNAGAFRTGSDGPTACTVTFAKAFPSNAFCTVAPAGGSFAGTWRVSTPSASGFTLTLSTGAASQWFNYTCIGG